MEKNQIENYLRKLQELDQKFDDDSDDGELLNDITSVINNLSNDIQKGIDKKTSMAELKFVNLSNNPDPIFAHEGDSGFDLRAFIDNDVIINQFETKLVPTGLYFQVNKGLEVQVRPRSGISLKNSVIVTNSPGTVDSKYRGQIQIIMTNLNKEPFVIKNGDRIAQGVVCPVYGEGFLNMIKVEKLEETVRNDGGFGHTGVK